MQSSYFETELRELDKSVINGIRAALGVSGLVSLIVGVMILAWPAKTAVVVAGFIAVYAAIVGLADLAVGIFSRKLGAWPRVGHLVVGVVFIVSAAVALGNLGAAATRHGSLVAAIDRLNRRPRGLRPFAVDPDGGTSPLFGTALLDPKRPLRPLQKAREIVTSAVARLMPGAL